MTIILALDPATKTGFATSDGEHGTIDLSRGGSPLTALRGFILAVHARCPLRLIAYEHAAMGAFNNRGHRTNHRVIEFHGQLRGIIEQVADEIGAPTLPVNPRTIKSVATGSGNASKAEVMRACKLTLGITPGDDNEADALMILEIAKQWERKPEVLRSPKAKPKKKTKAQRQRDPQRRLL